MNKIFGFASNKYLDAPLTQMGYMQAMDAGSEIFKDLKGRSVTNYVCSDLLRSQQTINMINTSMRSLVDFGNDAIKYITLAIEAKFPKQVGGEIMNDRENTRRQDILGEMLQSIKQPQQQKLTIQESQPMPTPEVPSPQSIQPLVQQQKFPDKMIVVPCVNEITVGMDSENIANANKHIDSISLVVNNTQYTLRIDWNWYYKFYMNKTRKSDDRCPPETDILSKILALIDQDVTNRDTLFERPSSMGGKSRKFKISNKLKKSRRKQRKTTRKHKRKIRATR